MTLEHKKPAKIEWSKDFENGGFGVNLEHPVGLTFWANYAGEINADLYWGEMTPADFRDLAAKFLEMADRREKELGP